MNKFKKIFLFYLVFAFSNCFLFCMDLALGEEGYGYSPSVSHLRGSACLNSRYYTLVKHWIARYNNVVQQVIAKEKELSATHHVFYHGQNIFFYVIQDLISYFQEYYKNQTFDRSGFSFLRFPSNIFEVNSINDFLLANSYNDYLGLNDMIFRISRQVLSVNLSLAGGSGDFSSSAFAFFVQNENFVSRHEEVLHDFFCFFEREAHLAIKSKVKETYRCKLFKLLESFQRGCLVQIFIPKDKVNQCVYMSQRLGVPLCDPNIMPDLFNSEENRYVDTSSFIHEYFRRPGAMRKDNMQARILFTNDIVLNPDSGVKIYRYLDLDSDKLTEFNTKIQDIFVDLVMDINE